MAVELIAQDPANAARVARLRPQVGSEITRLRDVVDSLLSFSRSPRIDRAPTDLAAVVARAVETLSELAAERGADVRVRAPGALRARCDAHKVQGVVVNLVKNAIEAGKRVEVALRDAAGEAIIEVADDGPGLSSEARGHLFEPFFTTKPNGTGLGLPTSRRFIEAHGGSIEVGTSPALGGALFRLRLPLEIADAVTVGGAEASQP
jgi:signal transduction histidine kinase